MRIFTILGVSSSIVYAGLGFLILNQQIHWTGNWEVLWTTQLMTFMGMGYIAIQGAQALTSRVSTLKDLAWDIGFSLVPAAIAIGPLFTQKPSFSSSIWWIYTIPIMIDGIFLFVTAIKLRLSSDFSRTE